MAKAKSKAAKAKRAKQTSTIDADQFRAASTSLETALVGVMGAPIILQAAETADQKVCQQIIRQTLAAAEQWMENHAGIILRAESLLAQLREGPDGVFGWGADAYTSAHAAGGAIVQEFYLRSYGVLIGKPIQGALPRLDLRLVQKRWRALLQAYAPPPNTIATVHAPSGPLRAVIRRERIAALERLEKAENSADRAENRAEKKKKFRGTLPRGDDALRLAHLIANEPASDRRPNRQIALEFTGGDESTADALLRTIRNYPTLKSLCQRRGK